MKAQTLLHLPEYIKKLRQDINELYGLFQKLNHQQVEDKRQQVQLSERTESVEKNIEHLNGEIERLHIRHTELEHMITSIRRSASSISNKTLTNAAPDHGRLFADNHDLDAFYLEFENRFRGTETEIKSKQKPYIDILDKAALDKQLPVVDLGCGRGEFLELLAENGYKPIGVDMNEAMVRRAEAQGFEAVLSDGIAYLMKQKSGTLSGVTGFHLAEHIPFEQVLLLMAEAYRCLAKGGVLLLETPNPESIFVGAFTFHYDPSHLKPLPPAIMQFSAKFKGFARADIVRLQPELTDAEIQHATKNAQLQDALRRLYGPRDYALVAYK